MKRILFALTALAAAAGAQATTVSFEYGLPVVTTTTEINQTGSLGLFDSTLGTLTGASIEVFGAAVFSFTGTNNASQAQNADITSSTNLSWTSSLAALNAFVADNVALSASSGALAYAVGQTRSFGPTSQSSSNSDDLSTILASLQTAGGGNFDLSCTSLSGLAVLGGGGNLATTQSTQAGCGARIVYTFRDAPPGQVPEPGTLALVGLALAGVGVVARRRKAA